MADKKITDLALADALSLTDYGVAVKEGIDYKYTLDTLVQLLAGNISTGSSVTTGTVNPQNTTGENGDVFINTTTNVLLQKVAGTWVNKYTFPGAQIPGKIRFFNGTPDNTVGNDGDLGLDYAGAKFYERANGVYVLRFSMLQGPAGATGAKGDKGDKGDNGNTILSGTSNPANSIGNNGDFYLNLSTLTMFGPKSSGAWPSSGYGLNQSSPETILSNDSRLSFPVSGTLRLTWDSELQANFGNGIRQVMYMYAPDGSSSYKWNASLQPIYNETSGNVTSIDFEGVFDTYYKLIVL